MTKVRAIISHDRHRDDYVYLVSEDKNIEEEINKVWEEDFGGKRDDCSGDYTVEEAIIKVL